MSKKIYSRKQVLEILGIKKDQLTYLFDSRRLSRDDFPMLEGRRQYTDESILKIKEALADVAMKA